MKLESRVKGFTLVELLVVIATLAVLAAILFPALGRARENDRRASCQSNLKQISLGMLQYSLDYNKKLVLLRWSNAGLDDPSDPTHYKWMDSIQPYMKSEQLFICPSSAGAKYRYAASLPVGSNSRDYGSYCVNDAYQKAGPPTPPVSNQLESMVSLTQIVKPAETVWIGDSIKDDFNYACDMPFGNTDAVPVPSGSPMQAKRMIERHLDTVNFLYCDGHVKAQKLSQVLKTNSAGIATAFSIEDD